MLTKTDVTAAYKLILGRSPESDEAVNLQIRGNSSLESLRDNLLTSPEFLGKVRADVGIRRALQPASVIVNSMSLPSHRGGRGRRSFFHLWNH